MKTAILMQLAPEDGKRVVQLKVKQLLLTFQPDALVVFRAKASRASGLNVSESYFPLSWSLENPLVPSS